VVDPVDYLKAHHIAGRLPVKDPHIVRFEPHVPAANPNHRAGVWVIDGAHAPLYWFPRGCPRVTVWPRTSEEIPRFESTWTTTAQRVHVIELGWLDLMRTTQLYRYDFVASTFAPWPDATGQWFTERTVEPVAVAALGDLLELHVSADIELRVAPSLWPAHDLAISDDWDFSIVRMRNARSRPAPQRPESSR
jgi:hypothetical protein